MIDDITLLEKAKAGDRTAFKEIVLRNKENVYHTAYDMLGNRHDAEDISQEVFLKAYRSLDGFRGESKVSTWLYRIVVNTCHDLMSRRSYKTTRPSDGLEERMAAQPLFHSNPDSSPGRKAESALIGQHIERALNALSPRERSVFVLRHYQDLSMKEIASILKISSGTVRSILFRSLQRLQKELSQYKPDTGLEETR